MKVIIEIELDDAWIDEDDTLIKHEMTEERIYDAKWIFIRGNKETIIQSIDEE